MEAPPKWAQELLLNALVWWEGEGNEVPTPTLEWSRRYSGDSSGVAFCAPQKHIRIRSGRKPLDAKHNLLHELAHLLRPIREEHSLAFWDTAWALYRWAKLPMRYCLQRERDYRKLAAVSYRNSRRRVKA